MYVCEIHPLFVPVYHYSQKWKKFHIFELSPQRIKSSSGGTSSGDQGVPKRFSQFPLSSLLVVGQEVKVNHPKGTQVANDKLTWVITLPYSIQTKSIKFCLYFKFKL